ncbi:hypothetical protein D3C80_1712860 [compost metagenome]
MVTTGRATASEAVKVKEMTFPVFAVWFEALLETIATVVNVGTVLSKVTLLALVVAVTAVPTFPATSAKAMLKGMTPFASAVCVV